ncbi:putative dentin sialophosphoprotein, partial [Triplophysa rosa]
NLQTRQIFGHQFSESDASGDTTRDVDSSSGTAAQGQSQSPVKPVGSAAARFQIRSAKTLQYGPARHIYEDKTAGERSKEEMRTFYESNKSKSLDWRGTGNTTGVSIGTWNFRQPLRRTESLDRNEPNYQITSYTEDNQPNSVPWRFQGSSVTGQGDRKDYPNSESTPGTMNQITLAMEQTGGGQSLPVRLKSRLSQRSIGDDRSPWAQEQQGDSGPDQTDNKIGIWVREQGLNNTEEVTGNQTIMERIEKLYGASCTDTKSDANSKDLLNEKRNCTSDSGQVLRHRKTCTDSPSGPLSPSDSQQRRPSYTVEKAGTFPRWFSKNEQTFFDKIEEPSTPEIRNDQRDASSGDFLSKPMSMETHTHKKFQSFTAADEKTSKMRSSEFYRGSLERTRSNLSDIAQPSGTHAQSTGLEGGSNISNRQQPIIATSGDIKKEEPTQPKYPLSSRGSAHCEMYQEDLKAEGRKGDGVLESSSDSVKNTIHKFEALVQQSQSASQILRARRALSVPEQPKPVVHVKKSDSDLNLKFRRVMGNTESVGTNPLNKVKKPAGNLDLNRTPQSNPTVQVKPTSEQKMKTYKTSIDIIPTFPQLHEPKPDQPNTWDENRRTVRNRHMDEPDLAIVPRSGLPNTGTIEKKSRNPTFQPTVSQQSNVNRLIKQQSIHVNMDDDKDDDDDDDTPTNSPNRDPLTINMQRQSNTVKPQTSAHTSYTGVFTSVKSAANGTHPKAVSNPSASLGPAQTLFSSLNNSNNNNYNTTRNDPGTYGISMARWSSDEENDDEDYEGTDSGDSDSGESSVTITSNMSKSDRRSFSLSYVELCIYGGVDYKPSDGSVSEDGEDWAPSRSASLSSDMSGFSSVTLLSSHELDRLLDDVKNLGDNTLQKYEDIQVVVLHKEVGCGLGFTLAGGVDQNKPVTVHRVIPEGVAAQEGSIFEGDWVLSINGTPLQKCAHWEALRTLRKTRSQTMAVVVLQRGDQNETQHRKEAIHRPQTGKRIYVTLNKSSYDLGFSLEGGVDSSSGDKPLTVQKIFQGGPVNKVFPGDELLEVQGQSLMGMRRLEAWNRIRRLAPGPVEVLLHRPHQPY